jgi:hypothetical protein
MQTLLKETWHKVKQARLSEQSMLEQEQHQISKHMIRLLHKEKLKILLKTKLKT